jgi:hypothetical protein
MKAEKGDEKELRKAMVAMAVIIGIVTISIVTVWITSLTH